MNRLVKTINISLCVLAIMSLSVEANEQQQQAALDQEDQEEDSLAFYDANAGTFYAGIWQHLTTPRNLEKDSPIQVVNPAYPLTDNHPKAY